MQMHKHIITALCVVGVAMSSSVMAAKLKIRPDAPTRYVVRSGDTLWGISGKYLYSPWKWPSLWGANRSQIGNPQRIYPGQVLVLRYVNGQPRLGFGEQGGAIPTVKLTPKIHDLSSGYGINTVDVNFYRMFMQHPQVINQLETQNSPKLVAGPDSRVLYALGDRVYADRQLTPGKYLVYHATKDILDPDTRKYLGQEVVFTGEVATLAADNSALANRSQADASRLPDNEYYTRLHPLLKVPTETAQPLVVTEAVAEIRNGDHLLKITNEKDPFQMMPHAPDRAINAKIVSIMDGIEEAGPYQTITLNKGSEDGLDKGVVLSLYKKSRQIKTDVPKGNDGKRTVVKYLSIPAEEVALAMVYRVSDHLASAIILDARSNVKIGDLAMNPGHDLDDVTQDTEHAPNVPEDPHEAPNHQYDARSNVNIY